MSDRYSSAYSESLRKDREERKRKQRRFEMKEKVKSFIPSNPFRARAKENEGIRTSNKFSRQISKEGNRPRNVIYVLGKVKEANDPNLTQKTRFKRLDEAERRIQQDGEMRGYYTKHAQIITGGRPTESEKEAAKQFVNSSIRSYPGNNRDKQVRLGVASWMITKSDYFWNEANRSGALKSYEKWEKRYGE